MKNMKKFITLCGFLILGSIACGDADVVKAEAINNQTTYTSGYTITIPSDVDIDKNSGKGSFAVTGKIDAQTKLDVTVNSQNGYKLKCGSKSIDYTLDKQSFRVDNIKSSDVKSFNENFDATLSYTDMNFSGSYKDKLTFNIESNVYIYKLDLNSILDGVNNYSVHDYGTADIYINGKKVADDVSDWGGTIHYGDTYEIKDIKGTTGHHYSGASDGQNNLNNFPLKGKIGIDTKHVENSEGILYSSIFLKFDTNTYTVKYDSNGGKGSMADTVHKYYKSDKMDGVTKLRKNAFAKTGYKFNGWYMTKTINGETYYLYDNWQWYKEGSQPSVTKKYLYVNERASSNATTVDKDVLTVVAQWSPITYTIKYDGNGADSGVMENTTHIYHASTAESGVVQLRKSAFKKSGYSFSGWVFSKKINGEIYYLYNNGQYNNLQWYKDNEKPAGVEKYIYNDNEGTCNATTIDGDTITAIAQWKKQHTLTFDANGGTVSETSRTVLEGNTVGKLPIPTKEGHRFYGWYAISNGTDWQTSYLILGSSIMTQDLKIVASWGPPVETLAKQNESTLPDGIYKIYSGISSFSDYNLKPRLENSDDENQILLKKEDSSEYAFWQIEHDSSGFVMFKNRKTGKYLDLASAFATSKRQIQLYSENGTYAQKWIVVNKNGKYQIISAVNPNFVLDLSNATLDGGDYGVVQLYYDNGTFAQRWVFEKIYTPGTIVNIDNNDYIMLQHKERNKYLLLKRKVVGMRAFNESYDSNTYLRSDGKYTNTYENSEIDKYLENDWYERLSNEVKNAIQISDIKQTAYNSPSNMFDSILDDWSVSDVGYNAQTYTVLQRHVYLPNMEELGQFINLNNKDSIKTYLKTVNDTEIYSIWTRDVDSKKANALHLNAFYGCLDNSPTQYTYHIAPAFVIDLSKIDYTVTGSVNYK